MTSNPYSNPDLSVGLDNKQRWNQPKHRRKGFHNAHRLFRRVLMSRSRHVLPLEPMPVGLSLDVPGLSVLLANPAFSAMAVVRGRQLVFERHASDFSCDHPHSIQSVTKMHIHLIVGQLVAKGLIDLSKPVSHYLPEIGSGYAKARIQDLLDMAVSNDFTEDYDDPQSDCYTEEIALGWRLPPDGVPETSLIDFACGINGLEAEAPSQYAQYKSANTDVLTLVCAAVSPEPMATLIEQIADAAGYEGAFHISLSPDLLPAFSGGGCLSARDLARFGLLFARRGKDIFGRPFADAGFLETSLERLARPLTPPKDWLRYSNHLMTDGRFIAHAGYGGQFLMVDTHAQTSCAFLSVLENDAGYDDDYMAAVAQMLKAVCFRLSETT